MKRCIIFCAGGFDALAQSVEPQDVTIAADGGVNHTRRLGITPRYILGDFDSLGFVPQGAEVFPVEKDDTDAMLAVKKGLALGCNRFYLYGALDGPRLDHTIANLQTLIYLAQRGAVGYLIGKEYIISTLTAGSLTFPKEFTGIFSLFCLGQDARGVTIRGAKYEAENVTLTADFPLGVSNGFTGQAVAISLQQGTILLLWDRKNGILPE